jgi:GT2 family glycosyltransferase
MEQKPVSIVFVTHNRKELLYRAIVAAKSQSVPVEIIVMDDTSSDGTAEMMQSDFPDAVYQRSEKILGASYQRNEGTKRATSDIIVFLDDDTIAGDKFIIEKTLADFNQPYVGAVAIPFINILQNNQIQAGAPDKNDIYLLHAFIGAAFAVKRDLFLKLGGFRNEYFYMGEEGDFCLRLLEAGYYVKAGTSVPAHHYQPANRVSEKADYYGRRNDIFTIYLNCPRKYIVPYMMGAIVKGLWFGIKKGRLKIMGKGIADGLGMVLSSEYKNLIKPIEDSVYLKFRYLKKNEPLPHKKLAQMRFQIPFL